MSDDDNFDLMPLAPANKGGCSFMMSHYPVNNDVVHLVLCPTHVTTIFPKCLPSAFFVIQYREECTYDMLIVQFSNCFK